MEMKKKKEDSQIKGKVRRRNEEKLRIYLKNYVDKQPDISDKTTSGAA